MQPCLGFDLIGGGSVRDDYAMHYMFGATQYALYQHWGASEQTSFVLTAFVACLKEFYDARSGGDVEAADIGFTMLGAITVKLADGVYFSFIKK